MAKLVDLTRPLVTLDRNNFPPALAPLFRIISPEIDFVGNDRGADIMCEIFSCPKTDLPEEEGWAEEMITLSSHLGTHVDAPLHYGSTCGGAPSKTIDQIPLDELYCDAVVLDMTHKKGTADAITVDDLKRALEAVQYQIKEGDAVLIRTDHDKFALNDPMRYQLSRHGKRIRLIPCRVRRQDWWHRCSWLGQTVCENGRAVSRKQRQIAYLGCPLRI